MKINSALFKKLDNVWVGVFLGMLLPFLSLYAIASYLSKTLTMYEFFKNLTNQSISTNIYIWSVIPVFFCFALFYFIKYDKANRGIIFPTLVYTFALVIYNY